MGAVISRAHRANYLYEILTGLYMLDAWEKVAFNVFVLAVLSISAYFLLGFGADSAAAAAARRLS